MKQPSTRLSSHAVRGFCLLSLLALFGCGRPAAVGDGSSAVDAGAPADSGVEVDAGMDFDAGMPGPDREIHFIDLPFAKGLSADGRLGVLEDPVTAGVYVYETQTGALEQTTSLPKPERNQTQGISNDGRIVADYGYPVQAGLWDPASGWIELGSPYSMGCFDPGANEYTDISGGFGLSANGKFVVGLVYNECNVEAFRWTDESGPGVFTKLQVLGTAPSWSETRNVPYNRANRISDDGKVIAGWAENDVVDRSPAIWNEDGTGFMLDPDNKDAPGEILCLSSDGQVAAGVWGNEGFVWTAATGTQFKIGRFEDSLPYEGVYPNAMALGGKLIFGTNSNRAFVWTEADGMKSLLEVITANGVEMPADMLLTNVLGASNDGTMVLGTAMDMTQNLPVGKQESFFLRLPVSAYGL